MKIAVIAYNREQWVYWLKEIEPEDRDKFYLVPQNDELPRGITFDDVISIGEAWKLHNYKEIKTYCILHTKKYRKNNEVDKVDWVIIAVCWLFSIFFSFWLTHKFF